jgi:hypothetical protein
MSRSRIVQPVSDSVLRSKGPYGIYHCNSMTIGNRWTIRPLKSEAVGVLIIGDFPQTEPPLFSPPRNIAERGAILNGSTARIFRMSHSLVPFGSVKSHPMLDFPCVRCMEFELLTVIPDVAMKRMQLVEHQHLIRGIVSTNNSHSVILGRYS